MILIIKSIIIDDIEYLNISSSNSLLKSIEEPNIKDKRDNWFANYAATHYNLKDLNTGYYFGKVKNLI